MSRVLQWQLKRRGHGHDEGFWPGYVDALTNVVLNLLFLVAILSAGVFSMGLQASRKAMIESVRADGNLGDGAVTGGLKGTQSGDLNTPPDEGLPRAAATETSEATTVIRSKDPKPEGPGGGVTLTGVRETQGHVLLTLLFESPVLAMSPAQRQGLQEQMGRTLSAMPDTQISPEALAEVKVWAISDKDPILQRAAYWRVLAVREVLLQMGVSAPNIHARMVQGINSGTKGQTVYVLLKATASNAVAHPADGDKR